MQTGHKCGAHLIVKYVNFQSCNLCLLFVQTYTNYVLLYEK